MAITKEQLIQSGIEETVATSILSNINSLFKSVLDNNYVSKEVFNEVNNKKTTLQNDLLTAQNEVKRLKHFENDVSTLNTTIADLNTQITDWKNKYDNQATVLLQENLVRNTLSDIVVDMDDVFPKIDMSKVVFKDGKIESGLTEQIDALKQSKPHYFKTANQNQQNQFFGQSPKNSNNNNNPNNNVSADVAFAKSLAQDVINQSKALETANNTYFKGGTN